MMFLDGLFLNQTEVIEKHIQTDILIKVSWQ